MKIDELLLEYNYDRHHINLYDQNFMMLLCIHKQRDNCNSIIIQNIESKMNDCDCLNNNILILAAKSNNNEMIKMVKVIDV